MTLGVVLEPHAESHHISFLLNHISVFYTMLRFLSFLNDPWRSTGTTRGITPYFVFAQPYFVFTKPYFGFSTSYFGSSTLYPARLFPEMYGTIESYPSETTLLCPDGVIFIFTTSFRRLCSFALLLALCLRPPYSCV